RMRICSEIESGRPSPDTSSSARPMPPEAAAAAGGSAPVAGACTCPAGAVCAKAAGALSAGVSSSAASTSSARSILAIAWLTFRDLLDLAARNREQQALALKLHHGQLANCAHRQHLDQLHHPVTLANAEHARLIFAPQPQRAIG